MKGSLKKKEGDGRWFLSSPWERIKTVSSSLGMGFFLGILWVNFQKKKVDKRTGFVKLTNFKERIKGKKSEKT
jgi:hypothetical protein